MLFGMAQATSFAAEGTTKGRDYVRVVSDQMHQLEVVKVEPYAFRVQRSAIGQIAFNEDATTIVLTPFSGRVIRLIAKRRRSGQGEAIRCWKSTAPSKCAPQNEFIAAQAAKNKARSQLNLAQIVEKRVRDLYEGKAAPFKDLQQAEAQLAAAESDMRSTDTAFEAAARPPAHPGPHRCGNFDTRAAWHAQPRHPDHGADRRHRRSRARSGQDNMSKPISARRCIRSPTSRRCG